MENIPSERVPELSASSSLFDVLGIRPERGRLFTVEENAAPQPSVALIAPGYWVRRFGGDPAIVGKRLDLGSGTSIRDHRRAARTSANVPEVTADVWVPSQVGSERSATEHIRTKSSACSSLA